MTLHLMGQNRLVVVERSLETSQAEYVQDSPHDKLVPIVTSLLRATSFALTALTIDICAWANPPGAHQLSEQLYMLRYDLTESRTYDTGTRQPITITRFPSCPNLLQLRINITLDPTPLEHVRAAARGLSNANLPKLRFLVLSIKAVNGGRSLRNLEADAKVALHCLGVRLDSALSQPRFSDLQHIVFHIGQSPSDPQPEWWFPHLKEAFPACSQRDKIRLAATQVKVSHLYRLENDQYLETNIDRIT